MTIIVNTGTTKTIDNITGLTIVTASTIAAGGVLDGVGTVSGNFQLLNQGTIVADAAGATLSLAMGTLTNSGTIQATTGTLAVQSGVTVTNRSGSTLTGGVWKASGTGEVDLLGGVGIVTDNATIVLDGTASVLKAGGTSIDASLVNIGTAGALNLANLRSFSAADTLVVDGLVSLGGGTLSVPNGLTIGATGRVAGFGAIDAGTPVVDNGIIEASGGTLSVPQAGNMSGSGTLQVDAGASMSLTAFGTYTQTLINNGTVNVAFAGVGGVLGLTGGYSGTGGFLIEGGGDAGNRAVLQLPGSIAADVAFDTLYGELRLDSPASYTGTISRFGDKSSLVLTGVSDATKIQFAGNLLTMTNGGGTVVQTLTVAASSFNYSGATFSVVENGSNNQATVTVTGAVACFAAGTRIATLDGDVAVEALRPGDVVRAHFAGTAPVVWVGHRYVDCLRHPEPAQVWPVRVKAHAFGPRMPMRDTILSPDHAVFVDDVLIPVKYLIDGKTIAQERVDSIVYYHVELAEHDVLSAQGLAAESYLEAGDRRAFDNAGPVVAMHPSFGARRWEAMGCAPMVVAGAALERVRKRLVQRRARRAA